MKVFYYLSILGWGLCLYLSVALYGNRSIIETQNKIISADLIAMQSAEKQLASALVTCKKVEDLERKLWDARK